MIFFFVPALEMDGMKGAWETTKVLKLITGAFGSIGGAKDQTWGLPGAKQRCRPSHNYCEGIQQFSERHMNSRHFVKNNKVLACSVPK